VFVQNFSAFIAWHPILLKGLHLKWNCFEKDKIPGIQNPFNDFNFSSWIFGQI